MKKYDERIIILILIIIVLLSITILRLTTQTITGEVGKNGKGPLLSPTDDKILIGGEGWAGETTQPAAIGSGPGSDAQAIALSGIVPHQRFDNEFNVGITAGHMNEIDRVEFSVNNGPWKIVKEESLNPQNGIIEYWATVKAENIGYDGQIEVRAIAYPKVGIPRVVSGMYLVANYGHTMEEKEPVYVSPTGSDTTGDGTKNNPLQTIGFAALVLNGRYGNVDGAEILLEKGEYAWACSLWPTSNNGWGPQPFEWLTIKPAPGVGREEAIINGPCNGLKLVYGGVKIQGLTLKHALSTDNGGNGQVYRIWFDNTLHDGRGGSGQGTIEGGFTEKYMTGSEIIEFARGPIGFLLVEKVIERDMWSQAYHSDQHVRYSKTFRINGGSNIGHMGPDGLPEHPDITFQNIAENVAFVNVEVYDAQGDEEGSGAQSIFYQGGTYRKDQLFKNVIFIGGNNYWQVKNLEHIIIKDSILAGPIALGLYDPVIMKNVLIEGNILNSVINSNTGPEVRPWEETLAEWSGAFKNNHYTCTNCGEWQKLGTHTTGDPGFVDPANNNYRLREDSILNNRKQKTSKYDIEGKERGETTAIGPYAGISETPPTGVSETCTQGTANKVEQYGITWFFDACYTTGQFANGDWWVLGPVTINSITPEYNDGRNGYEINPVTNAQGFDSRGGGWDPSLIPTLPRVVGGDSSIIKVISFTECQRSNHVCLDTAAILTVLKSVPELEGSTTFRPGYSGTEKRFYKTTDLKTEILPSLPRPSSAPSLQTLAASIQRVQLEAVAGWTSRVLHPEKNMPNYGSDIAVANNEAGLGLMLDYTIEEKMPLLINYVQDGIDIEANLRRGVNFNGDGGGHGVGRLAPIAFTAKILDAPEIFTTIENAGKSGFSETDSVGTGKDGRPLWGQPSPWGSVLMYWRNLDLETYYKYGGSLTLPDPHEIIDGGDLPSGGYQDCCVSQPIKGSALIFDLMNIPLNQYTESFVKYADRWVTFGVWAEDTCAPFDGNWENYGVTFGPDGTTDKDGTPNCVLDKDPSDGIGRFPYLHGTRRDSGSYRSNFVDDMWRLYRGPVYPDTPTPIDAYPPVISNGNPRRTLLVGTTQATLSVTTDEAATCKYSTIEGTRYNSMTQTFTTTGGTTHTITVTGLENGRNYNYYVRCQDASSRNNQNRFDYPITFATGTEAPKGIGATLGLIAYYTYNKDQISENTAIDLSGNNNHGTMINNPKTVKGKLGEALEFNGANHVMLSEENFNLVSGLTIGAWISITDPSINQVILTRGNVWGASPAQQVFNERVQGNKIVFQTSDKTTPKTIESTSVLTPNTWYFVVATFNGEEISLYIDGNKESTATTGYSTLNSNPEYSKSGTAIGVNPNYWNPKDYEGFFTGTIDDLRVYNRALTEAEILEIYNLKEIAIPSPSCTDNIKNGEEERIDCGGSCKTCTPKTKLEEFRDKFDGETTDLNSIADLSKVNNLKLEKTGLGHIAFNREIDFKRNDNTLTVENVADKINTYIKIFDKILDGYYGVSIDSQAMPELKDHGATITLKVGGGKNINNLKVEQDGKVCPSCKINSYDSNTGLLTFTVDHWTNYTVIETNTSSNETNNSYTQPSSGSNVGGGYGGGSGGGSIVKKNATSNNKTIAQAPPIISLTGQNNNAIETLKELGEEVSKNYEEKPKNAGIIIDTITIILIITIVILTIMTAKTIRKIKEGKEQQ